MQEEFAREIRLSAPSAEVWTGLLDFKRVASWIPVVAELRELEQLFANMERDLSGGAA